MATRQVHTALSPAERGCLYCLGREASFLSREHVIPRRLGEQADRFVLAPGAVCDPCNHFLGRHVDSPFTDRFDLALTRGLEALRDRHGRTLEVIDGRSPTACLDVQLEQGGPSVRIFASRVTETDDGGLDIEVDPLKRDPPDIVARTLRALWKIALGVIYLAHGRGAALDPRWDDTRRGVLGASISGYLLQQPFRVLVTRQLDVSVDADRAASPTAVRFTMGGVALAAPLTGGERVSRGELRDEGWEIRTTWAARDPLIRLRLDPSR